MTATPGSGARTAITAEPAYVERFAAAERALHWVHATAFFAMLGTGLALYLPGLTGVFGSRTVVKTIHLYVAGGWIAALLVLVAVSDRRLLRRTLAALEHFDADDRRWLRREPAPQGRFNAGQKIHAIIQAAFSVLFVISGTLLFFGERDTRFRLSGTILLHDGLTVFATALVIGHLYLSLIHPATRPSLSGIVRGNVDSSWARQHHSKWAADTPRITRRPSARSWVVSACLLAAAIVVVTGTIALVSHSGTSARSAPLPASSAAQNAPDRTGAGPEKPARSGG